MRAISVTRLIAIGFAVGATIHAVAFVLIWFGINLYGPSYPSWRHAVMATVDFLIAWIGVNRPLWLFVVLPAWIAEQWFVNGLGRPIPLIVLISLIALAWQHWCGSYEPHRRES